MPAPLPLSLEVSVQPWARLAKVAHERPPIKLRRSRLGLRGGALELGQDFAKGGNQLVARNMALPKLNPEFESFVLWFELKNERLRTLRTCLLLAAFTARFIARQPALHD